jgi:CheY-specific phosphatase CheX
MNAVLSEVVEQLGPAALIDVFASYGLPVTVLKDKSKPPVPTPAKTPIAPQMPPGEAMVAGVVGFTGVEMRGTLLLVSAFEVIAAARPPELRQRPLSKESFSDWILVRDWSGELANQVLGRIKNRLHRYGVTFDVSPPTALSGAALTFATPKGRSPQYHVFKTGDHKVWFCFDAIFDPGRKVSAEGAEGEAAEGKVILFE